jgi:hypothetical protein
MNHSTSVALLAVLPGAASDRARRFAREVAGGIASRGMGLVLPPLVIGQPPSWSPDLVVAAAPAGPATSAADALYRAAIQVAPLTPAQSQAAPTSWWPPSTTTLAVGGGALALVLLGWAVLRRRGGSAPAPIVVVSSKPEASPVKANRFVRKGGRRWSAR